MTAAIPSVAELLPLLTRDVIEAISDRPHESEARRQARADGAYRMIVAFEPADAIQIMLAGQMVLLQNLLLDAVHDSHRSTTTDILRQHRQQILSMGKIHMYYLKEFVRRRGDPAVVEEADRPVLTASAPKPAPDVEAESPARTVAPPRPASPASPVQPPIGAQPPAQATSPQAVAPKAISPQAVFPSSVMTQSAAAPHPRIEPIRTAAPQENSKNYVPPLIPVRVASPIATPAMQSAPAPHPRIEPIRTAAPHEDLKNSVPPLIPVKVAAAPALQPVLARTGT